MGSSGSLSYALSMLNLELPGINTTSMVDALQAEDDAAQAPLLEVQQQQQALATPIQAWQSVQSDLQSLATAAGTLATASTYQQLQASSSAPTVVSASSTSGSYSPGVYTVSVSALAQNEIVNLDLPSGSTGGEIGMSGSFTVNGQSIQVTTSDTLNSVASEINSANAGVSAVVLTPTGGTPFLSIEGGTAAQIVFGDPNGILSAMGVTLNSAGDVTADGNNTSGPAQASQMAAYTLDGQSQTSDTNTITGLPGLTLNLLATNTPTTPATITTSQNTGPITSAVNAFAAAFNKVISDVQKYGGKGGALEGNAALNGVMENLTQMVTGLVAGQPASMSMAEQAGITLSAPVGSPSALSMSADSPQLSSAISADPGAFASLWDGASGIGTQVQQMLTQELASADAGRPLRLGCTARGPRHRPQTRGGGVPVR